jgi:thiamine-phosphate pyrophosphorylase
VRAPRVIAITDSRYEDDHLCRVVEAVGEAVAPGELAVQVRDKLRSASAVLALADRLARICVRHGLPLIINDRIDIALAVEAEGVHLGRGSVSVADARRALGDGPFVSVAAHSVDDVLRAEGEGANAALLSPIFASPGKGEPLGIRALEEARRRAPRIELYALGGVDARSAELLRGIGAGGVAVLRAIFDADDPAAAARALLGAFSS